MLILLGIILSGGLSAQTVKVTGTVFDESGDPLIGVSIHTLSNESKGTVSDLYGKFSIEVDKKEKLVFSYLGFAEQVVAVEKMKSNVNIFMQEDKIALDEVVVIGYGTAKKKDITGSISSVSADKLEETPAVSLNQALQGKSAGVQVEQNPQSSHQQTGNNKT